MDPSKFFKNIKNLLIVVLIVVILLLRQCGGKVIPGEDVVITKIETKIEYDTITQQIPEYIPEYIDRYFPADTAWKYKDIDTSAILEDYFATYYYSDVIEDDSVKITINDSIRKNKIASRNLEYEILYPIKTITITEEHYLNKREFYVGPRIGASPNALEYIGIEAMLKTKKRTAIGLGIGVDQTFQPQLQFGLYWKLRKNNKL
jgi:hypothetical protein